MREITIPTLTVKNGAGLFTFDLESQTDDFILTALRHGLKQKLGDAWGTAKDQSVEGRTKAVQELYKRLCDGEWAKRMTDGERVDVFETCIRSRVAEVFVKAGQKSGEAQKMARDAKNRLGMYVKLVITPQVMAIAPDRVGEIDSIARKNWDKLLKAAGSEAEAIIAAKENNKVELDLD